MRRAAGLLGVKRQRRAPREKRAPRRERLLAQRHGDRSLLGSAKHRQLQGRAGLLERVVQLVGVRERLAARRRDQITLLDTGAALSMQGRLTAYCADDGSYVQVNRGYEVLDGTVTRTED